MSSFDTRLSSAVMREAQTAVVDLVGSRSGARATLAATRARDDECATKVFDLFVTLMSHLLAQRARCDPKVDSSGTSRGGGRTTERRSEP